MSRTDKGISWVRDAEGACAKILVGDEMIAFVEQNGSKRGYLSKMHQKHLAELLGDRLPSFVDRFLRESTHVGDLGYAAAHRSRWCLPHALGGKDEIRPLERHLPAFVELIRGTSRTIHRMEIFDAAERALKLRLEGIPGVYLRGDPEQGFRAIYIGKAANIAERQAGHTNAGHRLIEAWTTNSVVEAQSLETSLRDVLRGTGQVIYDPAEGYMLCDVDGVELVREVMARTFRGWARNTVRLFER